MFRLVRESALKLSVALLSDWLIQSLRTKRELAQTPAALPAAMANLSACSLEIFSPERDCFIWLVLLALSSDWPVSRAHSLLVRAFTRNRKRRVHFEQLSFGSYNCLRPATAPVVFHTIRRGLAAREQVHLEQSAALPVIFAFIIIRLAPNERPNRMARGSRESYHTDSVDRRTSRREFSSQPEPFLSSTNSILGEHEQQAKELLLSYCSLSLTFSKSRRPPIELLPFASNLKLFIVFAAAVSIILDPLSLGLACRALTGPVRPPSTNVYEATARPN